jgi:hypothetical protein
MRRLGVSRANLVLLCGFLCGAPVACDRSSPQSRDAKMIQRANAALSSIKLPVLPDGVTEVHFWAGGVFAKYMNVKFKTSRDQALDYFKDVGAKCYFEFDSASGEYQFTATHFLTDSKDYSVVRPSLSDLREGIGHEQPWFKSVFQIRHGWYYDSPGVAGFQLYYDLDEQEFYLSWHYS